MTSSQAQLFGSPSDAPASNVIPLAGRAQTRKKTKPTVDQDKLIMAAKPVVVPSNYHVVDSIAVLKAAIRRMMDDPIGVGVDTETTGLDLIQDNIVGITLFGAGEGHLVLTRHRMKEYNLPEDEVEDALYDLTTWEKWKFFHNASFDLSMFRKMSVFFWHKVYCTYIASVLMNEHDNHSLKSLVKKYLGKEEAVPFEEVFPDKKVATAPIDALAAYAIHDAEWTRELGIWQAFQGARGTDQSYIDRAGLRQVLDLEMSIIPIVVSMMARGVRVDLEQFRAMIPAIKEHSERERKRLFAVLADVPALPVDFNPDSPEQVLQVLHSAGVKVKDTNAKTLAFHKSNPIVERLLAYRHAHKRVTTYGEAFLDLVHNGRLHTSYNQVGAASGRFSSSNPNLQNQPNPEKEMEKPEGERAPNTRLLFVPDPQHVFISADYSGQELRIMAHVSRDENMIRAFREDKDLHRFTASKMFRVPEEQVTSLQRKAAKSCGFGILYGSAAPGLAQTMTREGSPTTVQQAQELLDLYFTTFPNVLKWMNYQKHFLAEHGFTKTILGRKRRFPQYKDAAGRERGSIERSALNHVIQGSGADMIKLSLRDCADNYDLIQLRCIPVLTVHDEIVFQVPAVVADEAMPVIKDVMEHVMDLRVPIVVGQKMMRRWGEM